MPKLSLLDRYLLREATQTWLGVTAVLLGIMLSTRFAFFLGKAAKGEIPAGLLMSVVGLSSLRYLVILVPVSLLLALMVTLGRLYKDQEIAAMTGCGVGLMQLYKPFMILTVGLSLFTGALAFEGSPWAGRTAEYAIKNAQRLIQFTPFEPGKFKTLVGGRAVFYTSALEGERLGEVLVVFREKDESTTLLSAPSGQQVLENDGDRNIRLQQGYRARGTAGRGDYEVLGFESLSTRVSPPPFAFKFGGNRGVMPTTLLLKSPDRENQTELHWRLAAPLSVLILGLLAVPLAHVRPRQGQYSKLIIGVGVYVVYSNLLGLGVTWINKGILPASVGLFWVHGLFLIAALWLLRRRLQGS
jgi:lipopolysaccharide export system permease protein